MQPKAKYNSGRISASDIAGGAMTLSLIFLSFMLFRGVTNILNAVTVPFLLYLYIRKCRGSAAVAVFCALFLLCFIFFRTQIFFVAAYAIFSVMLIVSASSKLNIFIKLAVSLVVVTAGITVSVWLTDLFFMAGLQNALEAISGNGASGFYVMMAIQGFIITLLINTGILVIKHRKYSLKI